MNYYTSSREKTITNGLKRDLLGRNITYRIVFFPFYDYISPSYSLTVYCRGLPKRKKYLAFLITWILIINFSSFLLIWSYYE